MSLGRAVEAHWREIRGKRKTGYFLLMSHPDQSFGLPCPVSATGAVTKVPSEPPRFAL